MRTIMRDRTHSSEPNVSIRMVSMISVDVLLGTTVARLHAPSFLCLSLIHGLT